jgi:hypothetical protein
MYHYVDADQSLHGVTADEFERQLDAVAGRLLPRDEFDASMRDGIARDGYVLTFDDGLNRHASVMDLLKARGMWGIFFFPQYPMNGGMLAPHVAHAAIAALGASELLSRLEQNDDWIAARGLGPLDAARAAYRNAWELSDEKKIKAVVNYSCHDGRDLAVNAIKSACPHNGIEDWEGWYTSWLRAHAISGAIGDSIAGGHGKRHMVLSSLSGDALVEEVEAPIGRGPVRPYAYAYGGRSTWNLETCEALARAGYTHAFDVEARDATSADLRFRWAIPRWDCRDPGAWR